mmetsp:Transcript_441/g.1356  ORF Transcript_441/g.1356 Transcript_441/m.1356 type:complete len:229 (-) Transcript_441:771-1457(-)
MALAAAATWHAHFPQRAECFSHWILDPRGCLLGSGRRPWASASKPLLSGAAAAHATPSLATQQLRGAHACQLRACAQHASPIGLRLLQARAFFATFGAVCLRRANQVLVGSQRSQLCSWGWQLCTPKLPAACTSEARQLAKAPALVLDSHHQVGAQLVVHCVVGRAAPRCERCVTAAEGSGAHHPCAVLRRPHELCMQLSAQASMPLSSAEALRARARCSAPMPGRPR